LKQKTVYILLLLTISIKTYGQSKLDTLILDSVKIAPKSKFISKLVKWGISSIRRAPDDTTQMNVKSEDVYKHNEGKYIRHIIIKRIKFEEQVTDTNKKLVYWGTQLMNNLHSKTREWVIRNNLFIHEGDTLQAYKIADNERYLRNLPFISDAKIYVRSFISTPDTIDLVVVTRDLFSITGGLDFGNVNNVKGQLADVNFLGMGQRLEVDAIENQERSPKTGYSLLYKKYNLFGSFVDAQLGYSLISNNLADQKEDEKSYYLSLDKPLISPYDHIAGGMYLGRRISDSLFPKRVDSLFYRYNGLIFDTWAGYNLAGRRLMASNVRDRKFIALRYAQSRFDEKPHQLGNMLNGFNDVQLTIGALTFFRQDYYKTNYIYGFGATEDIPYGYKFSLIGGWMKQYYLERVFGGIKLDWFHINHRGDFYRYFLRFGGFYDNNTAQDAGILTGINLFSRLFYLGAVTPMRQYISTNYTRLFRLVAGEQLRIDNAFGLPQFTYQYVTGYQRFTVNTESIIYLKYKLLGFKFAPFADINLSALTPLGEPFQQSDIYTGFGGGIRTRNENLVFGTVELKGMFFPRRIEGMPTYKIELNSNIKYRYNSNFVSAPDVIKWNSDDNQ
jgi:hypothetical protein